MILYLQEFIYKALSLENIAKKVHGIYFQKPGSSYFPYIYVGEFNLQDISTKAQKIEEIYFLISIYLQDKSLKSMLELAEEVKIVMLIRRKEKIANISLLEEKILVHNDEVTRQINMKFKAIVSD